MRVLRVHAGSASEAVADTLSRAIERFNRALDIRLRFLSIGIEEREVRLDAVEDAPVVVAAAAEEFKPALVLLCGSGEDAVAAAATAARLHLPLVRLGAGRRTDADADSNRAIDRIAAWHLCDDDASRDALTAEGLTQAAWVVGDPADPEVGPRVVDALSRIRRANLGGS